MLLYHMATTQNVTKNEEIRQRRRRAELPPAQATVTTATQQGPRMHHLATTHLIGHSQDPCLFQRVQLIFLRPLDV